MRPTRPSVSAFDLACNRVAAMVAVPLVVKHEGLHIVLGEVAVLLQRGEVELRLGFLDCLLGAGLGVVELDEVLQSADLFGVGTFALGFLQPGCCQRLA